MHRLPDLHRHLDGSLRPETLRALADEYGVVLPDMDLRFETGMTLADALARFEVTLSVLQHPDAVRRVANEMCEDAMAEGVTTLEIRFAPQLHEGGDIEAIVDAAVEGIAGRAGLILCGLYGEPPSVLDALVDAAAPRHDVVGIDLAGGPTPGHDWGLEHYAGAFGRARDLGLGRTVHAGEGGRPAREIGRAIELLHAQRIGHAISLLDDPDVVQLAIDAGVTLEACPTSNVQTSAIARLEDHPLPKWLARGLKATVCTDNVMLSDVDSPEEHRRALRIPGMTEQSLARCIEYGHAAAFVR